MDYSEYKKIIREKLDDYRYNHSLCVADEALRLARMYGVDTEKAYLAGLLHDITKNIKREEHLLIFSRFGIMLSDAEKSSEKLWHAMSGAAYVKNVLKIDDSLVISAIRYHTTGRKNMSELEKVVYLADFTSLDRKYNDVNVMRHLVNTNINEAMEYSLRYTINDLLKKNVCIHPDTVDAYNEIVLCKGDKVFETQ